MSSHPDQIPAGSELDALIAEKVMRWSGRQNELWTDSIGHVTEWGTENCHWRTTDKLFRPSADLNAALLAADVLRKVGADIEIELFSMLRDESHVRAAVTTLTGEYLAAAADPALALCRAMLKAVSA